MKRRIIRQNRIFYLILFLQLFLVFLFFITIPAIKSISEGESLWIKSFNRISDNLNIYVNYGDINSYSKYLESIIILKNLNQLNQLLNEEDLGFSKDYKKAVNDISQQKELMKIWLYLLPWTYYFRSGQILNNILQKNENLLNEIEDFASNIYTERTQNNFISNHDIADWNISFIKLKFAINKFNEEYKIAISKHANLMSKLIYGLNIFLISILFLFQFLNFKFNRNTQKDLLSNLSIEPKNIEDLKCFKIIKESIKDDKFVLYAQTIKNISKKQDNKLHFEILLRLNYENKIISPAKFIIIAEKYNLMKDLDKYVIKKTLIALKEISFDKDYNCSINLSSQSLSDKKLLDFIKNAIQEFNCPAENLCFEITENNAIKNIDNVVNLIKELKTLGCKFAIDDFGVGMSNFQYLQKLPVDFIKLDGSFIKDILTNKNSKVLVETINSLAHAINKKTIAEYVENEETLSYLKAIKLDYAQGYLIDKPFPLNQKFLDSRILYED